MIKFRVLPAIATTIFAIGVGVMGDQPGYAEGVQFDCYPSGYQFDQPMTVVQTPYASNVPIILWKTPEFGKWAHEPEERCKQVSQRLQSYYNCDLLDAKYIGAATLPWTEKGKTTFYPAVVITHPDPTPCSLALPPKVGSSSGYVGLLFMMPPEQDAFTAAAKMRQILNQLDDLRFTSVDPIDN